VLGALAVAFPQAFPHCTGNPLTQVETRPKPSPSTRGVALCVFADSVDLT